MSRAAASATMPTTSLVESVPVRLVPPHDALDHHSPAAIVHCEDHPEVADTRPQASRFGAHGQHAAMSRFDLKPSKLLHDGGLRSRRKPGQSALGGRQENDCVGHGSLIKTVLLDELIERDPRLVQLLSLIHI